MEDVNKEIIATQDIQQTAPEITPEPDKVDTAPDPAALQAEIDRLEKVRQESEEKAVYWRKQKAESRADFFKNRVDVPPPQAHPAEDLGIGAMPAKPKQEDFDDWAKFQEAQEKYLDTKISYEVNRANILADRETVRKAQDNAYQGRLNAFKEKLDLGYTKYPDFGDVARDPSLPITGMVRDIMTEFDNPEDIAYYLGKNRSEVIQLARMTPIQVTKRLAQIEAEIKKAGPPPSNPNIKIPSAPPPINPVGSSHTVTKDPEKMTQKEYEAFREAQGARRF